jgi:protein involved in polysaccharide export with SLBB domain
MSSNGRFGLFPQGHRLTEDARNARSATPPPGDIARELDKRVAGPFVVEPGDVLLVQPVSLDSPVRLPGDQPVLLDGTIHLGKYGQYPAAGKTVAVIEAEITALIRRHEKDPGPITARLVTRESKVFYVLGEVNAPGSHALRGRETVLDAILAAGGLTGNASRRGIFLSRPTPPDSCRIVLPVCYNDIVQMGDPTTNYQIRPGDRVYVPSRTIWEDFQALFMKPDEACCRPQAVCPPGAACGRPITLPVVEPQPPAKMEMPRLRPEAAGEKK